jgi:hypothetical protein
VGPFDVIELQRPGDSLEDVLGYAADVAALELCVVLDADPCQHRHLLAAQAGDATPATVGRQADLFRGDPGPAAGQELPDLVHDMRPSDDAATPSRYGPRRHRGRGWQYP